MDETSLVQDQGRDQVQEETERIKEEGPVHIQVIDGKDQTENQRSVQT
jgi:hypothetical protein